MTQFNIQILFLSVSEIYRISLTLCLRSIEIQYELLLVFLRVHLCRARVLHVQLFAASIHVWYLLFPSYILSTHRHIWNFLSCFKIMLSCILSMYDCFKHTMCLFVAIRTRIWWENVLPYYLTTIFLRNYVKNMQN